MQCIVPLTDIVIREAHSHEVFGRGVVVHLVTSANTAVLPWSHLYSITSVVVMTRVHSLEQYHRKGLHQPVEGGFTHTLRVAALLTPRDRAEESGAVVVGSHYHQFTISIHLPEH